MVVAQADSTLTAIKKKVRRLTSSSSEASLTNADLEAYINDFYNNDFPYAIKIDQMRSVYTFYTEPYRDRYPLDVNYNQGIRAPMYVEGIEGQFFKDRQQFYNMWPRWPTKSNPFTGDGVTTAYSFTLTGTPFLANEVVLGVNNTSGLPISVSDDGNGNMLARVPNAQTQVPNQYNTAPGMHNENTGNPGQNTNIYIGTIDYVTGVCTIDFALASQTPGNGEQCTVWVSQYQTGRPYTLLFWNNEFIVRPVPKLIHKIEIETYQTPVQFLENTDSPILNQWWKYIATGAAMLIQQDRNDFDAVSALSAEFDRQEALALERQGVEEIGQRNATIFSSTIQSQGWNNGWGVGWM